MSGQINSKGSTHIVLTVVIFLLVMGAWHVYDSWKQGNLESDVKQVIADCIDIQHQVIEGIKNYK